jgi:hypothetical protein
MPSISQIVAGTRTLGPPHAMGNCAHAVGYNCPRRDTTGQIVQTVSAHIVSHVARVSMRRGRHSDQVDQRPSAQLAV